MLHLQHIKNELRNNKASRLQRSRFNYVVLHNKGNWISDSTLRFILHGGKATLDWLPEMNPLATAEKGFYYLKTFDNTDEFNLTKDGMNIGYTYKDIIEKISDTFLKDNYNKTIDGVLLQTELVHGSIYKVNYTVYSHDITENEDTFDYKLHSKEFKSLPDASAFVNNIEKKGNVVSVDFDTNAVPIFRKYTKYVPLVSSLESIGRGLQKRYGSKVVRVTWLVKIPQNLP